MSGKPLAGATDPITQDLLRIVDHSTEKRAGLLTVSSRRSRLNKVLVVVPCVISAVFAAGTGTAITLKLTDTVSYQLIGIGVSLVGSLAAMISALVYDGEVTQRMRFAADRFMDVQSLAREVLARRYADTNDRLAAAKAADAAYRDASKEAAQLLPDNFNPSKSRSRAKQS